MLVLHRVDEFPIRLQKSDLLSDVDSQCTASKDKPDVCLMSYVNKLNPDILIPFTFQ